jgi:hypothetical protein
VSEEYREAFGSHAYDTEGNYIGGLEYGEFTPETEAQAAWAEYATEVSAKSPDDDEVASDDVASDEDAAAPAEISDDTAIETSEAPSEVDPGE